MGHRDWADVDVGAHLDELDRLEASDNAVDAMQQQLATEFRTRLAMGDQRAAAALCEAFGGLPGTEMDALLADAALGGDKLQARLSGLIYVMTLDSAIKKYARGAHDYSREFRIGSQA